MRWQAVALAGAVLAVAGCSSTTGPTGTVAGTYIRVGNGSVITVSSSSTGTFTAQLPPGTYGVTATSSLINDGKSTCSRPLTTRVQAGKTVSLTIICDIR